MDEYYGQHAKGAPVGQRPLYDYGDPYEEEPEEKRSCLRSILDLVVMVAAALAIAFLLRTFVVQPYQIPSGSMEPTIAVGNMVLGEKLTYIKGEVEPGDIITFDDPTGEDKTLIKRCIAVAGQTVDLVDGVVYVDGVALDEPYTYGRVSEPFAMMYDGSVMLYPYTVPEGYIWVMGDNRTNSADSRYFGAVPVSSVEARAFFTYWPLSEIGTLE